jgi:hypothetical protein
MTEGSGAAPGSSEPSLVGVLPDVVRGLRNKPALLFGIGAGVILVAVLGVTANVWLVLIVAGVFVISLLAWLVGDAHRRRDEVVARRAALSGGGAHNVTRAEQATVKDSDVGVVEVGSGSVENVTDVTGAKVTGSNVGVVGEGTGSRSRRRKRG